MSQTNRRRTVTSHEGIESPIMSEINLAPPLTRERARHAEFLQEMIDILDAMDSDADRVEYLTQCVRVITAACVFLNIDPNIIEGLDV